MLEHEIIANLALEKNDLLKKRKHEKFESIKMFTLKLIELYEKFEKSWIFSQFIISLSIIVRILCIFVLTYVILVMINETDSWIPLVNFLFCFGIIVDLIYFIKRKKEHTGLVIM